MDSEFICSSEICDLLEDSGSYLESQTIITKYMHEVKDVGLKIGWQSQVNDKDELFFDKKCNLLGMQYFYAKAGLRQRFSGGSFSIREASPYTAFEEDRRFLLMQPETVVELKKRHTKQWIEVIQQCSLLIEDGVIDDRILPEGYRVGNNNRAVTWNVLRHWAFLSAAR